MADTAPQQSRPERVGRKGIMTYVPDDMGTRLKVIAAERRTTIQKIGEEAFTEWLAKHDAAADVPSNVKIVKVQASSTATLKSAMMKQLNVGDVKPLTKAYRLRRSDKSSAATASSLKRRA